MGVMKAVDSRFDSAALIDIAVAHGYKATPRSLELWRYRGLLPRPERQTSGRAVWLYPPGTEHQLLRLLHWRGRTRNLGEVLLALWIEGFEIELDYVREALVRFVDRWDAMIKAEVAGTSKEDEGALVDSLARKFARMRGEAGLPRGSRMRLSDRERACGYLVAAMFGMNDELAKRETDLPHLERLLGIRRGHDGGLSPELGLKNGDAQVARLPTPEEAREPVQTARPYELEFVRRVIRVFLVVLPAVLPALLADQAAKAVDVIDFARRSFTDSPPALFPFMVTVFLVSLRAKELALEDLREPMDALDPSAITQEVMETPLDG
jgi:hypothetical protein